MRVESFLCGLECFEESLLTIRYFVSLLPVSYEFSRGKTETSVTNKLTTNMPGENCEGAETSKGWNVLREIFRKWILCFKLYFTDIKSMTCGFRWREQIKPTLERKFYKFHGWTSYEPILLILISWNTNCHSPK